MTKDETTRDNIKSYHTSIEMPGGYYHNLPATLKRITAYYNSEFLSGQYDELGQRKIFYNICKPPCDIATKFVDLDTKHIILHPEGAGLEYKLLLIQKKLKYWLKKVLFSVLLNQIGDDFPKGHVVVKKSKGKVGVKWDKVLIFNLRMHPGASSLENSPFAYELLEMTSKDIKKMGWNGKDLEQVLASGKDSHLIYECYELNQEKGKKWKRRFLTGLYRQKKDNIIVEQIETMYLKGKGEYLPSLVLHEDEVDKLPYRELKWEDVDGRWLGFGFVEYLFHDQIRVNEISYLKGKSLYLKALQIFITKDETLANNLIKDVDFGQVLHSYADLIQVRRDNVDLSAYNQEEERWNTSVRNKTFATDIARGDNLPASTPGILGRLQAGMTASYFERKRENYGLFVKSLLFEDVIPDFKKQFVGEHKLFVAKSDADYETLLNIVADAMLENKLNEYAKKYGTVPSWGEVQLKKINIEERLRGKRYLSFKMPKGYYDNIEYQLEIVITDESIDMGAKQSVYQFALATMAANPHILLSPASRTIFFKMIELTGQSPVEINLLKEAAERSAAQAMMQPAAAPQQGKVPQAPATEQSMAIPKIEL